MITTTNSVLSTSASPAKTRLIECMPLLKKIYNRKPRTREGGCRGDRLLFTAGGYGAAAMMEQWLDNSDGLKVVLQTLKGLKEWYSGGLFT